MDFKISFRDEGYLGGLFFMLKDNTNKKLFTDLLRELTNLEEFKMEILDNTASLEECFNVDEIIDILKSNLFLRYQIVHS